MGGCVCDVRRHFNWNRCFFSSPSSFTVCHDVSYQTFLFLKIFFSLLILTTISYHPQFSPWFVIVFLSHISSWHWSPNQHWTVLRFTLKKKTVLVLLSPFPNVFFLPVSPSVHESRWRATCAGFKPPKHHQCKPMFFCLYDPTRKPTNHLCITEMKAFWAWLICISFAWEPQMAVFGMPRG